MERRGCRGVGWAKRSRRRRLAGREDRRAKTISTRRRGTGDRRTRCPLGASGGRKVRTPEGSAPGNPRSGRPEGKWHRKHTASRRSDSSFGRAVRVKRCGKSAPRPPQGGWQAKPRTEQDRIGRRSRAARPKPPGRLLDPAGDGGARGMVAARRSSVRGRVAGTEFGLSSLCGALSAAAASSSVLVSPRFRLARGASSWSGRFRPATEAAPKSGAVRTRRARPNAALHAGVASLRPGRTARMHRRRSHADENGAAWAIGRASARASAGALARSAVLSRRCGQF